MINMALLTFDVAHKAYREACIMVFDFAVPIELLRNANIDNIDLMVA